MPSSGNRPLSRNGPSGRLWIRRSIRPWIASAAASASPLSAVRLIAAPGTLVSARAEEHEDGLWIIAYGQNGMFGLAALSLTLLVLQLLFLRRFPVPTWRDPAVAALVPLSVLLGLFMIDNLLNDMFNPVMLLSAGGITGLYIRDPAGLQSDPGLAVPDATLPTKARAPRLL